MRRKGQVMRFFSLIFIFTLLAGTGLSESREPIASGKTIEEANLASVKALIDGDYRVFSMRGEIIGFRPAFPTFDRATPEEEDILRTSGTVRENGTVHLACGTCMRRDGPWIYHGGTYYLTLPSLNSSSLRSAINIEALKMLPALRSVELFAVWCDDLDTYEMVRGEILEMGAEQPVSKPDLASRYEREKAYSKGRGLVESMLWNEYSPIGEEHEERYNFLYMEHYNKNIILHLLWNHSEKQD